MFRKRLIAGLAMLTGLISNAHAALNIVMVENASGVTISYSGSIDLTDANMIGLASFAGNFSGLNPSSASLALTVVTSGTSIDSVAYTITGPASFGSGTNTFQFNQLAVTGTEGFSLAGAAGVFFLAEGYASGSMMTGVTTFMGATFASLGLTPGTYTWLLPSDQINMTIGSVPLPGAALLFAQVFAAGWLVQRRKKRIGAIHHGA
ncbi:hypothetical protein [Parvularcula sp. LCG005]|uniref:hypothetical protein n=1 Tax=Parvularcula sp. LCG005 TaxID=3078805 RepID=UPI0029432C86|nr:hypothetical protein [Parvularcula sp. LCG005]WOI52921.1 hypothetical protein RUI03_12260 [Parvularcula sp. LCG005]